MLKYYKKKTNKAKNYKNFTRHNFLNDKVLIENFNPGDYISIFYLREENLEKTRVTGLVLSKNNKSKSFKLFINNEIILLFNIDSPFIVKIINLVKPTKYKFKLK